MSFPNPLTLPLRSSCPPVHVQLAAPPTGAEQNYPALPDTTDNEHAPYPVAPENLSFLPAPVAVLPEPQGDQVACLIPNCEVLSDGLENWWLHTLHAHCNELQKSHCFRCHQKFSEMNCLRQHLQQHLPWRACLICNLDFLSSARHDAHLLEHQHNGELNTFTHGCFNVTCNLLFKTRHARAAHMKQHHPRVNQAVGCRPGGPYKCTFPNCASSYTWNSQLSRHVKTHQQGGSFHCKSCPNVYKRMQALARHSKQAHQSGN